VWAKTPAMSVSTEVQRTLVKSPPELWAELSNPEALARHLGELGDIRITSTEPETKVEWEAEAATGTVHLKQSGWGTKVTLSVTRLPSPGDAAPQPIEEAEPPEPEPPASVEPEPESTTAVEPAPEPVAEEPELELEPATESEPVAEQPIHREGFFARLFRRRKAEPVKTLQPEPEPEPEPDFEALAAPDLIYEPTPQPAADLAAELTAVEVQMEQETTELLTGVLDRLGAAHHRPFSRG
jgi:hypothetical protein